MLYRIAVKCSACRWADEHVEMGCRAKYFLLVFSDGYGRAMRCVYIVGLWDNLVAFTSLNAFPDNKCSCRCRGYCDEMISVDR